MIHDPSFLAFRETSDRLCESMRSASCYQAATFPQAQVRFHDNRNVQLYSRRFKAPMSQMKMGVLSKDRIRVRVYRNRERVGDVQQSLRVEYTFTGWGVECLSNKAHISLRTRVLS
jgi:hypothetical protein